MRSLIFTLSAVLLLMSSAGAQVGSTAAPDRGANRPAQAQLQPAPAANVNATVAQLERTIQDTRVDLAKLRVDKWKTDSAIKRQAQDNVESLERNMSDALPALEAQVRSNPASVTALFKLYRNVNAIYDVLGTVTESAGAFGPKEDYQALANDIASLDALRRSLADQVEGMASAKDTEVARLQTALAQARQAAANTPPKKIIIDENEPPKKPVAKKPVKKKPATEKKPATQEKPASPPQ